MKTLQAASRFLLLIGFTALLYSRPLAALERDVVISAWQGPCVDGDFAANLATARSVVQQALERHSDFLAFPETFLSGYVTREKMLAGARNLDGPEITSFIAESAGHNMVIIVGLARKVGEEVFNTELVIQHGKLLGTFDKVMLTGSDRDKLKFTPGLDVPVFTANGARFAVIICHDTSFPQPGFLAKLRGAEILFTPHYNSIDAQRVDEHRKLVRNNHVGLACLLKMALVRSNVVVLDRPGSPGYGDSFIMTPEGEVLAGADLFRTELVTATLTAEMFRRANGWASLDAVPAWLNKALAEELVRAANP